MELTSSPKVKDVFNNYPKSVQHQLLHLRELVLSVASEIDGLEKLEETLKWGEPSYKYDFWDSLYNNNAYLNARCMDFLHSFGSNRNYSNTADFLVRYEMANSGYLNQDADNKRYSNASQWLLDSAWAN